MKRLLRDSACFLTGLLLFVACDSKKTTLSPQEQIREGWKQYRLGEFNAAVEIFRSIQAFNPNGSEYHLQALYGEASCWNHRRDKRDVGRAVAGYRAVVETAPQNPLAAWCALDIVRTKHLAPADQSVDYEEVVRDYAEVYRRYPQTLAGAEAFLYESSLSLPAADSEKAHTILESVTAFLSTHPDTPFLSQFYDILAECYRKMNDQDRRIEHLIKALAAREIDAANPIDDRSTAYWNIAYAAEFDAGNFEVAREYYRRLIDEYPQDVRVFGVRKALERMDAIEAAVRKGRTPAPDLLGGISVSNPATSGN